MSKVEIRNVMPGDEKVLAYIQTESWKAAFNEILSPETLSKYTNIDRAEKMYKRVISSNLGNGSILTVDGTPHCIAFWDKSRDEDYSSSAELICIHSLRDRWRQGFGSMMMEHILSQIKAADYKDVILWVFEKNIRARSFYEKHGFVLTDNCKEPFGAAEVMYIKKL